jgi:hypothetical protein
LVKASTDACALSPDMTTVLRQAPSSEVDMKLLKKIGLLILLTISVSESIAGEWDVTGLLGLDSQTFWQDGRFGGQRGGTNFSVMFQPELYWRSESARHRFSAVGFARADHHDGERSHADIRELYWGIDGDSWDLNIGVNKIFWGVTESRHLVDVINQTDLVEDIDQEDKLGQPMINLNLQRDYGRFELFVLPWFRERTFPGADGRFRSPLPVDTENPVFESSAGNDHVDLAFRYSHFFGDLDVGAYLFDGTSREPSYVLAPEGDRLFPVYDQMKQFGVDLQLTRDAWLWKLESIYRDSNKDSFAAVVGGIEYTFYGVTESVADVGVLLEYLFDDRGIDAPPTTFDNDLFAGVRLALNDSSDTSVLAGIVADLDTSEVFFNVEAERRMGDNFSVEVRLRAFMNAAANDLLHAFEHDDYVQLRLSWYY